MAGNVGIFHGAHRFRSGSSGAARGATAQGVRKVNTTQTKTVAASQATKLQPQDKRDIIRGKSIAKTQQPKNELLDISRANPHRKGD